MNDKYVIGSFGKNALSKKINKEDRLTVTEIKETLPYIKSTHIATKDSNNIFRLGNKVLIAQIPNGENRAIIIRKNKEGVDEIINAFTISKNVKGFIKNLGKKV